jgi:hypothetical protein
MYSCTEGEGTDRAGTDGGKAEKKRIGVRVDCYRELEKESRK